MRLDMSEIRALLQLHKTRLVQYEQQQQFAQSELTVACNNVRMFFFAERCSDVDVDTFELKKVFAVFKKILCQPFI